jgi:hypothetical protein
MEYDQRLAGEIRRPTSREPFRGSRRLQRGEAEDGPAVATQDERNGRVAQVAPTVVEHDGGVG